MSKRSRLDFKPTHYRASHWYTLKVFNGRWVFSSSLLHGSGHRLVWSGIARRAAAKGIHGLIDPLLTLVFPEDCRICGASLKTISRVPVCDRCLSEPQPLCAEYACSACRMPFVSAFPLDETGRCSLCRLGLLNFDAVYSYGSYAGTLRTLVHLLKFEKMHTLARPLSGLILRMLPREQRFDFIVPVPLHWWRRKQRGFNQSELLAKEIGARWNAPVAHALRRVRATTPQTGLTNAKRRANLRGAFQTASKFAKGALQDTRILLVDDVITTGTSAAACAAVLKRAGAAHVAVAAVARTDRRLDLPIFALSTAAAGGNS